MSTDNCTTCRYSTVWVVTDAGTDDEARWRMCRRRPPTVLAVAGTAATAWPQVDAADKCGEWERPSQPIPDARPIDERT